MPGVSIEITSYNVVVRLPSVKCVGSGMRTDKSVTRLDEIQKGGLLLVGHRQLARGVEHDRIEFLQIVPSKRPHILGHRDVKGAGLLADFLYGLLGQVDAGVMIANGQSHVEKMAFLGGFGISSPCHTPHSQNQ